MERRLKVIAWLVILGAPFYVLCGVTHWCFDGHLAHGPRPWYEWLNDFWWVVCYVCAMALSVRLKATGKRLMFGGSLCFLVLRPITQGLDLLVAFLLLPFMLILAVKYLKRPHDHLILGVDDAPA